MTHHRSHDCFSSNASNKTFSRFYAICRRKLNSRRFLGLFRVGLQGIGEEIAGAGRHAGDAGREGTLDAVVSDRAGLTDAGFRGSGDGQRVPRVGTLLATRSATLPGTPRSPVHQLNMTVLRSPPSPSDLPAPLTCRWPKLD